MPYYPVQQGNRPSIVDAFLGFSGFAKTFRTHLGRPFLELQKDGEAVLAQFRPKYPEAAQLEPQ